MNKDDGEIPLLDEYAPAQWSRFSAAEQSRVRACLRAAEAMGYAGLAACLGATAVDSRILGYVRDYLLQHPIIARRVIVMAQTAGLFLTNSL